MVLLSFPLALIFLFLIETVVPSLDGPDALSQFVHFIMLHVCETALAWIIGVAFWASFRPAWLERPFLALSTKVARMGQATGWLLVGAGIVFVSGVVVVIIHELIENFR